MKNTSTNDSVVQVSNFQNCFVNNKTAWGLEHILQHVIARCMGNVFFKGVLFLYDVIHDTRMLDSPVVLIDITLKIHVGLN